MAVLQDININVHGQPSEKRLQTFLRLSQNENGRMINFRVLGPPLPSNCTATFSGTKPDGNVYSKTGTVAGNFVIIQEDMQMTAVAGVWDAKLDIINGSHNIMTALIRVVVDADVVDPDAIASDSQLQGLVAEAKYYAEHARTDAYGSPLTAPTKAQMTDHTRVYVYTGSEPNMVAGNWYLWNGSAWVSGGVYNAVAVQTDTTLSVAGKAADGKATGDALDALKEDLNANAGQAEVDGWESGYYVLNASATTVDVENRNGSSSGYVSTYMQCKAGDVFYVTSKGASAARPWAFLSSASEEGNIISKCADQTVSNVRAVAPSGSAYVVFNAKVSDPYFVISGERLNVKTVQTETNIDFNDSTLPYATLADLPQRRIFRTINAPDRPSNQAATTGFSVLTLKPLNANNYTQIGINAKTGRMWARYAGASTSYSSWAEIGTGAANDTFVASRKTVRMLCIGNSFSQDSVAYMPFIIRGLTDSINLTLGIAYVSGGSLQDYVERFDNDSNNVTFNKLAYDSNAWVSTGSQTIKQILSAEPWDMVTFQQASRQQETWDSDFTDYLNPLIDRVIGYIATTHSKSVRAGWLMPQIRYNESTADSYANMIECVKKVLETSPCSFVIPCGTGIHLARQDSTLDALGESGHLTKDGAHLQEGLPCLLSAYVSTMTVLNMLGIGYKSILGEQTRPTQDWITAKAIPGQNGTSVGVTDANCYLAQKIATQAIKFPYGEE